MTDSSKAQILDIDPWARCPLCGAAIPIEEGLFERFFRGARIDCSSCLQALDWWETALHEVAENFMLNQAFALVSARSTVFRLLLHPGKRTSYQLADFYVPDDAKVLYVNYTPNGSLFPVELHSNVATVKTPRQKVHLWPVPLEGDHAPSNTEVCVLVTWVPHSQLDDSWKHIVLAFEAYVASDYAASVVPANVAIESYLSITLNHYLPQYAGKERTRSFLKDAATYSHQLNVVLPLITGLLKRPRLPERIRGLLNRLRKIRNDIVHLGITEKEITKKECAELLCAAIFGFQYVRFLKQELSAT